VATPKQFTNPLDHAELQEEEFFPSPTTPFPGTTPMTGGLGLTPVPGTIQPGTSPLLPAQQGILPPLPGSAP
ncbi:hypothetical protein JXA12_02475, partial [Candidatus Woesearchaeota archaeon]|nr:hypothetical protein [Candidatus Woesearchaeota archaeon]